MRHQNLIGRPEFLRGFISRHWLNAQQHSHSYKGDTKKAPWDIQMTAMTINLHTQIWDDRNGFAHGRIAAESQQQARAAILQPVKDVYSKPPTLASRFQEINHVPLEHRLQQTTTKLSDWLARVEHQIWFTSLINSQRLPGQLTLQEAFQRAAKKRDTNKFPP